VHAPIELRTPEQARALLSELQLLHREMVIFALATGLRQSNVVELTWSQVDLNRGKAWVYRDKAKGKQDIHVSLSDVASAVLRRQTGQHPERYSPTAAVRSHGRTFAYGEGHSNSLASKIFAGMICGIRGRVGTCRTGRLSTICRKWAAGNRKQSFAGMRISLRRRWQDMLR
jgi:integrase